MAKARRQRKRIITDLKAAPPRDPKRYKLRRVGKAAMAPPLNRSVAEYYRSASDLEAR